jgi:hypothetical protein
MYSIYKISSKISGQCYIGSTTIPLNTRLNIHRSSNVRYINGKGAYISSIEVLKHGDAEIELIEELPEGTTKRETLKREGELMTLHNSINKNRAGALLNNANYHRDYYKNNKQFSKCVCGSDVSHHNNKQHLKTKRHLNYLKNE